MGPALAGYRSRFSSGATWHGFALASPTRKTILLKTYWNIPDRQVDTSVVLANPPLDEVIE